MKRKRVAVLILNYNGKKYLSDCYESLLRQSSKGYDLYLVDNNSQDGSRSFTKSRYPSIHVVNTGGNLGFTGAYNFVVRWLKKQKYHYDVYFFLNNDTICDTKLIESMLPLFDRDPRVGIVTPTILNGDKTVAMTGGTFLPLTGTTMGFRSGTTYKRSEKSYECFWASGCALGIRSSLFQDLGMFPDYFIYYEDVGISWSVRNAGYKVVALQNTYIIHYQGKANTPSDKQLYLCERNRILTYWQNLPSALFILLLPIFLGLRLLLLFYLSRTVSNVVSKIRGIRDGFALLHKYPKRVDSLLTHIQVFLSMPSIRIYHAYE